MGGGHNPQYLAHAKIYNSNTNFNMVHNPPFSLPTLSCIGVFPPKIGSRITQCIMQVQIKYMQIHKGVGGRPSLLSMAFV